MQRIAKRTCLITLGQKTSKAFPYAFKINIVMSLCKSITRSLIFIFEWQVRNHQNVKHFAATVTLNSGSELMHCNTYSKYKIFKYHHQSYRSHRRRCFVNYLFLLAHFCSYFWHTGGISLTQLHKQDEINTCPGKKTERLTFCTTSGVPKSLPPCSRNPHDGSPPLFNRTVVNWAMLSTKICS